MIRLQRLAAILWLCLVSFAYYRLFPFDGLLAGLPRLPAPQVTGGAAGLLLVLALFVFSANGWGKSFWKMNSLSRIERFVFASGLGFGIMALLTLLAGLAGIATRPFFLVILLTGAVLFLFTGIWVRGSRALGLGTLSLIAAVPLASSLIGALAPPTQFDSLVYHLALPARYLKTGTITAVPHNFFFAFPQNMEMLFQAALGTGGDLLANLVHWVFLPLTALALFAFCRRYWDQATALVASALWLFTPTVLLLSTGTYVDLGLAYFVFLSFYAFMLWTGSGRSAWLAAAGLFVGLAAGVKYTAIAAALVLGILVVWRARGRRVKAAFLFSACVLAPLAPWLLKNLFFLHNPIAPWGYGVFRVPGEAAALAANYFEHIRGHGVPVRTVLEFVALPWQLSAYGYRFGGAFDSPGPLFLLFIPVLFLIPKIDRITRTIVVFTVGFCLVWLMTGKVLRFLLPVVPLLTILAAHGFRRIATTGTWERLAAIVLLSVALVHNTLLYHWTMSIPDPYSVSIGRAKPAAYLAGKLNYFPAIHNAVNTLPPDTRVLFWGETRGYHCRRDAIVPTVFDAHPLVAWADAAQDPRDLARTLREHGITHILVNGFEAERLGMDKRFSRRGLRTWRAFARDIAGMVYRDPYCFVLSLGTLAEKTGDNS